MVELGVSIERTIHVGIESAIGVEEIIVATKEGDAVHRLDLAVLGRLADLEIVVGAERHAALRGLHRLSIGEDDVALGIAGDRGPVARDPPVVRGVGRRGLVVDVVVDDLVVNRIRLRIVKHRRGIRRVEDYVASVGLDVADHELGVVADGGVALRGRGERTPHLVRALDVDPALRGGKGRRAVNGEDSGGCLRDVSVRNSARGHVEVPARGDIAKGKVVLVLYRNVLRVDDVDDLRVACAVEVVGVVAKYDVILSRAVGGREVRNALRVNVLRLRDVALGDDVKGLGRVGLLHAVEDERLVVEELDSTGRRRKLVDLAGDFHSGIERIKRRRHVNRRDRQLVAFDLSKRYCVRVCEGYLRSRATFHRNSPRKVVVCIVYSDVLRSRECRVLRADLVGDVDVLCNRDIDVPGNHRGRGVGCKVARPQLAALRRSVKAAIARDENDGVGLGARRGASPCRIRGVVVCVELRAGIELEAALEGLDVDSTLHGHSVEDEVVGGGAVVDDRDVVAAGDVYSAVELVVRGRQVDVAYRAERRHVLGLDVPGSVAVGIGLLDCTACANADSAAGVNLVQRNAVRVGDIDVLALDGDALAFAGTTKSEVVGCVAERDVMVVRRDRGQALLGSHCAGCRLCKGTGNRDGEIALGIDDVKLEAAGGARVVYRDVIASCRQRTEHIAAVVEGYVLVCGRGDGGRAVFGNHDLLGGHLSYIAAGSHGEVLGTDLIDGQSVCVGNRHVVGLRLEGAEVVPGLVERHVVAGAVGGVDLELVGHDNRGAVGLGHVALRRELERIRADVADLETVGVGDLDVGLAGADAIDREGLVGREISLGDIDRLVAGEGDSADCLDGVFVRGSDALCRGCGKREVASGVDIAELEVLSGIVDRHVVAFDRYDALEGVPRIAEVHVISGAAVLGRDRRGRFDRRSTRLGHCALRRDVKLVGRNHTEIDIVLVLDADIVG